MEFHHRYAAAMIEAIFYFFAALTERTIKSRVFVLNIQILYVFCFSDANRVGILRIINDAQSLDCRFLRPKILYEQCGEDEIKEAFGFHKDVFIAFFC